MFGSRMKDAGCVWLSYEGCWLCLALVWRMLAVSWLSYEGCLFGSSLEDAGCVWFSYGGC